MSEVENLCKELEMKLKMDKEIRIDFHTEYLCNSILEKFGMLISKKITEQEFRKYLSDFKKEYKKLLRQASLRFLDDVEKDIYTMWEKFKSISKSIS